MVRLRGLAAAVAGMSLLVALFAPSPSVFAASGSCVYIDGPCLVLGPSDIVVQNQPTCASIGGTWDPTLFLSPSEAPPDGANLNLTRVGVLTVFQSLGQHVCAVNKTVVVGRGDPLAAGNSAILFINSSGKIVNQGTFGIAFQAPPQNPPPEILNSGSIFNYNLSTFAFSQDLYNLPPIYLTYEGQVPANTSSGLCGGGICHDQVAISSTGSVQSQDGSVTSSHG